MEFVVDGPGGRFTLGGLLFRGKGHVDAGPVPPPDSSGARGAEFPGQGVGVVNAVPDPVIDNVGLFVTSALLLDLLLWLFIMAGWESASIPGDFASTHQAGYVFPYSHGLVGSLLWSAAAGACSAFFARAGVNRVRLAALIAAAVFSHWQLDWLVHRPELPLAGQDSPMAGLGLWHHLPLALAIEARG